MLWSHANPKMASIYTRLLSIADFKTTQQKKRVTFLLMSVFSHYINISQVHKIVIVELKLEKSFFT